MGYETDVVTLVNAQTLTASGVSALTFSGSDWVRGHLLVKWGAVSGTSPTFQPFFQMSPDNGTTWIGAAGAANPLGNITAVTPVASTNVYLCAVPTFPGTLFRLAWTIGGTTPSMVTTVIGDFQKWLADST